LKFFNVKEKEDLENKKKSEKKEETQKPADEVKETPTVETPSVETPTVETPTVETPTVETPSVETPTVETPSVETPSVETPSVETPSVETPSVEESKPQISKSRMFQAKTASTQLTKLPSSIEQPSKTITAPVNAPTIIKKLIEYMNKKRLDVIEPLISFEENRIKYPILEQIGESKLDADALEQILLGSGEIFERTITEKLVVCPTHSEDLSITIRLYCPSCSSMDIERLELIEHKVCGYIAEKLEYGVVSTLDVRMCPNCKRQIRDFKKEIKLPGNWNFCHSCNKKFDDAILKLHCRRFNHDFDIHEMKTVSVPVYKLKKSASDNKAALDLIPMLKELFTNQGFTVDSMIAIKGKSGISHPISIYAENKQNTVAVFIKSARDEVPDTEINDVLVNVLDISPSLTILIGIPSISERAKAMATSNGISLVSGKEINEIVSQVTTILSDNPFSKSSPMKVE